MEEKYKLDEISNGILHIIEEYKKTKTYKDTILRERKEAEKEMYNWIKANNKFEGNAYIITKEDIERYIEK